MRLLYGFVGVALALALVLYPLMAVSFSFGAPPAFNGAPGGNGDCRACHRSFDLNSGTGSVMIDVPATFAPGDTLTFTVSVDNTTEPDPDGVGRQQGFEVSVQDPDQSDVGTLGLVDDTVTQFADGEGRYVTHEEAGNTLTEWTVEWTAPAEDAPDAVTFYVAGNAGNGDEGPDGDYIYTTTATVARASVASEDAAGPLVARLDAVYPNPSAGAATAAFTLDRPGPVTVTLYDGLGRTVRVLADGARAAGAHTVDVAADGLPSGVYFVEVRTAEGADVRPVTVAR